MRIDTIVVNMDAKTKAKLEIKKKEDKIKDLRMQILDLDTNIAQTTAKLKDQKYQNKSNRVAKIRLNTHSTEMSIDSKNRPPDKSNDIRTYTKMDLGKLIQ